MIAARKRQTLSGMRVYGLPNYRLPKTGTGLSVPCPNCGSTNSSVTDSRPVPDGRYRRRRCCGNCELRFTTYEQVAPEFITDYQI